MDKNPFAAHRSEYVDPTTGELDYESVVREVVSYIRSVDQDLDLSRLSQIRAGPDYGALVSQVGQELGRASAPTNRQSGSGMAIVVPGDDRDVLVIHQRLLDAMFGEDASYMLMAVNTVHHELAHSHDNLVKLRNLHGVWGTPLSGWFGHLFQTADAVWSEYFANRRSYETLLNGECLQVPILLEELEVVPTAVGEAVQRFDASHHDYGRLYEECRPHVAFLVASAGYVLGSLRGAVESVDQAYPVLANALRSSCLGASWSSLDEQLDGMWNTHGKWSGIQAYQPLHRTIISVFRALGLELTMNGDARWLNVVPRR